jgi:hypothetical protein
MTEREREGVKPAARSQKPAAMREEGIPKYIRRKQQIKRQI